MRHINYHCKQHPENNAISTWYFRLAAVLVILLVILTANGIAQESTGGSSAGYSQVVSANPFGVILLPWYNGEYERKITESITLGLSGSRLPWALAADSIMSGPHCGITQMPLRSEDFFWDLGPRIGMYWVAQDSGR